MKEKVVILGNGSMARVMYSYIKDKFNICGFCVDKKCITQHEIYHLPVVPFELVEESFPPIKHKMINCIGYLDMNSIRKEKSEQARKKGYTLLSYIDSSVKIHKDVEIEDNCIILDFVSIHVNTKIKEGTFISSNVNIGHDCIIDSYNWINSGVSIAGFANIGEFCFWGINSSCANNINIGNFNYISANTLINKNTNDNEVYISEAGNKFQLSSKNFLKFLGG